jgi:lipopolysaccharide export system ATP-binding protein
MSIRSGSHYGFPPVRISIGESFLAFLKFPFGVIQGINLVYRIILSGNSFANGAGCVMQAGRAKMSLIESDKLVKSYRGRRVVNSVSVRVEPSEVVGLLGPNGAGKTTTFNLVVGLIKPDSGKVRFDGQDITGLPMHLRARRGIGYLTQEPSVFRKLTVEQNILAILETCKLRKQEREVRLKYLLDELDLTPLAKSIAYQLSGGEKRRLEVTRALVTSPKLLLLDEPFSGIDPIAVYEVQKILRRLKERGLGILITDHNVRETLKLVDRAYLIHRGEVILEGTAEFLVNDPKAREIYLGPEFNL